MSELIYFILPFTRKSLVLWNSAYESDDQAWSDIDVGSFYIPFFLENMASQCHVSN